MDINKLIAGAPDNFVIRDALLRCVEVLSKHNKVACSVSGADSDVMLDMIIRCGGMNKTTFMFYDTGLEYQATKEHLTFLEEKYDIVIHRTKAKIPIPISCREFGVPFWSKRVAEMMYRLQRHNFQWEDEPFETLIKRYPRCQTALEWWCNVQKGETTQYIIGRNPYLKEYIIANPPQFNISAKCCDHAKKLPAKSLQRMGDYDLVCTGVRKSEGGVRADIFHSCFSEAGDGKNQFRPVFWFRDTDRDEYCQHYSVTHSRCYTEYGLLRTGCFGCPFGKRFEEELAVIEEYEPQLLKGATNIFGKSYDYTRGYIQFRDKMKALYGAQGQDLRGRDGAKKKKEPQNESHI